MSHTTVWSMATRQMEPAEPKRVVGSLGPFSDFHFAWQDAEHLFHF